jgi:hypothetical protein
MQVSRSPDLARTILQFLALGGLIAASFWILQPFLISLVWAGTVAIATWPLLLRTQWLLGGRRAPEPQCERVPVVITRGNLAQYSDMIIDLASTDQPNRMPES